MVPRICQLSLVCFCTLTCSAGELILSEESQVRATVVVSENGPEYEKHAAAELADFLSQVTGATVHVAGLDFQGNSTRLLVGTQAAKLADKAFSLKDAEPETVVLRTVGNDLIVAGQGTRGTLYAVYTFLGEVIGCRWWTSSESTIPRKTTLRIDHLNYVYAPQIIFRKPYWSFAINDANWNIRNMVNGMAINKLDRKLGTIPGELGKCHSYYEFLPPEKYFDLHPEWYSQVDGRRLKSGGQLCLTNLAMTQEFTTNVLNAIGPEKGQLGRDLEVWVAQNDWGNHCQCDSCSRLTSSEGSPSAGVIYFANNVANTVAKHYPNVMIKTFAYDWSQQPPRNLAPVKNVIVQLATTGCSYFQAYNDPQNAHFAEILRAWGALAPSLYVWDYPINISAYVAPHPNLRIQSENLKFLAKHNVRGMFANANWDGGTSCAEFGHLRAWTSAKLYWNPDLDGNELIREFVYGYYGAAGKYIEQYINLTHDIVESGKIPSLGMGAYPGGRAFTSLEVLIKAMQLLYEAKTSVAEDSELLNRVEVVELQMLYLCLLDWDRLRFEAEQTGQTWPMSVDIQDVFQQFQEVMKRNKATAISEKNARGWWPFVEKRVKYGEPGAAPKGLETISPQYWQVIQDSYFWAPNPASCSTAARDELASDERAARAVIADGTRILVTEVWRVPILAYAQTVLKKPIKLYATIRCEMDKRAGDILTIKPGNQESFTLTAEMIEGIGYEEYLVGKYDSLGDWTTFELHTAKNPNVKQIWIDRLWIEIVAEENEIKNRLKDHEALP
ncbi:MAG: DUF4838 domain-containing protein [Pirellulaceae bacterium]|nr:DUF4838 domain-containing protein [Pirellulaceae bacterium]